MPRVAALDRIPAFLLRPVPVLARGADQRPAIGGAKPKPLDLMFLEHAQLGQAGKFRFVVAVAVLGSAPRPFLALLEDPPGPRPRCGAD